MIPEQEFWTEFRRLLDADDMIQAQELFGAYMENFQTLLDLELDRYATAKRTLN